MSFIRMLDSVADNLPNDLFVKTGQSFIASTALGLFLGGTPGLAVLSGAVAATATIIEAVARPIIRATFPQNPNIGRFILMILAYGSAVEMAKRVAPLFDLAYKTASPLLCGLGWASLNDGWYERDRAMAVVI